ncbi:hypothetical protein [Sphingobacterium athyrii]|uniref:hypothetical protein n=1 Tax=Sphingobacterium athyrii TaxID=2152717 RepID=UPI0011B2315C|nr:hypothetical protein [Sphingobacterium athyrii]
MSSRKEAILSQKTDRHHRPFSNNKRCSISDPAILSPYDMERWSDHPWRCDHWLCKLSDLYLFDRWR